MPKPSAIFGAAIALCALVCLGQEAKPPAKPNVLIVGGGSSHDFKKWFDECDRTTLKGEAGSLEYTEKPEDIVGRLGSTDVLYLSNNQPLRDEALRKGIFGFADAGKGLLIVHPATWNNWADWPEYNAKLVGGGASSHQAYGEFEVKIVEPSHAVTKGVAASFRLKDELYRFKVDASEPKLQILATATETATGKTYPVVWINPHAKARVVCITLGHDGAAHENPEFQKLLRNSCAWAAGRN